MAAAKGRISKPTAEAPTGRYTYAIQPDGSTVEYAQWNDALVENGSRSRIIKANVFRKCDFNSS